jgi:YfiR/HmsC-like
MKKTRDKRRSMRAMLRLSCTTAFLMCPVTLSPQTVSQYNVEAAYLYDFGKFIRWPADVLENEKSFDICVLGQDPFDGTLQHLVENEQMNGRPMQRRVIARASEGQGCAIVYVADSEAAHLEETVVALNRRGELLVSGLPHFLEDGGTIQFVIEKRRVRFEVNLDSASKDGLILSSELLKVAVSVVGKPQSGAMR